MGAAAAHFKLAQSNLTAAAAASARSSRLR